MLLGYWRWNRVDGKDEKRLVWRARLVGKGGYSDELVDIERAP